MTPTTRLSQASDVAYVSVTNEDNDVAGVTVSPTVGLETTEDGVRRHSALCWTLFPTAT